MWWTSIILNVKLYPVHPVVTCFELCLNKIHLTFTYVLIIMINYMWSRLSLIFVHYILFSLLNLLRVCSFRSEKKNCVETRSTISEFFFRPEATDLQLFIATDIMCHFHLFCGHAVPSTHCAALVKYFPSVFGVF